jgi:hypothetical protein
MLCCHVTCECHSCCCEGAAQQYDVEGSDEPQQGSSKQRQSQGAVAAAAMGPICKQQTNNKAQHAMLLVARDTQKMVKKGAVGPLINRLVKWLLLPLLLEKGKDAEPQAFFYASC